MNKTEKSIEYSYQIVLADDHAMIRQGLKKILARRDNLKVIGEAADGLELLDLLSVGNLNPNLVLVDITMPNLGGIEATRKIKMIYPEIKVLILTIHKSKEYLDQAISAGAKGYLLKEEADGELFTAIDRIREGGVYVSPLLSKDSTFDNQ